MQKEIFYRISFPEKQAHYCEIEITLKENKSPEIIFSMPVWAPGSYLIREFSRNVDNVYAESAEGKILLTEKLSKNTWKVSAEGESEFTFRYRVYCNELTVRTSCVNSEHAFISSSGVFMFAEGMQDCRCTLEIDMPHEWSSVSTGMDRVSENTFTAENYDVFIDSPLEIGNQTILEFSINGVSHYICLAGKGNYDGDKLVNDFRKIAEEQIKFFGGEILYRHYTYIINLVEKGGGGLEHLNSFAVQIPRLNFSDKKLYNKFLGLVSHEFFHLWNVKRIRPVELGPFDYNKENYTRGLWVAEGWTSYFDNVFIRRAGLINDEDYFGFLAHEYNDVMRFSGRYHQSLADSSFDAWIKFYRKDENYNNTQISYYTKGALVALILNLEIIKNTDGKRCLDDAMRILYDDFRRDSSKGYTQQRIREVCEAVNGRDIDEFWEKYVEGKDELPMEEYLDLAGLKVEDTADSAQSFLGIESRTENGNLVITKVLAGGSAYISGLNFKDEIISMDGYRVNENNAKNILSGKKTGDTVKFIVGRDGLIKEINVILAEPFPMFEVKRKETVTDNQEKIFSKWIYG
ncbi:MAG: M61 family metallopeptidase [Bacteroidetes bacterium]|nr:M61 family metallopeptidase [Bacteroidota bacterium]